MTLKRLQKFVEEKPKDWRVKSIVPYIDITTGRLHNKQAHTNWILYNFLDDNALTEYKISDTIWVCKTSTFQHPLFFSEETRARQFVKFDRTLSWPVNRDYYYVYVKEVMVYLGWEEYDGFGFTGGDATFLTEDESWLEVLTHAWIEEHMEDGPYDDELNLIVNGSS